MRQKLTLETINSFVDIEGTLIPELKLAEANRGTANPILVFLITIVLFFSSRVVNADVYDVLILVLVLLIHELGHFLAMKALKYDDLKMFFIPFLGAAVSGKCKNDSTLKSCLVSIMGPLPGILLAVLSFIVFGSAKQYFFLKFAEISLFLNVLNLLPILPLDGGRFVESLFYHNRAGRFLFSCFGALVFVVAAFLLKDILLFVVGCLSILKIPTDAGLIGVARKHLGKGIVSGSVSELSSRRDLFDPLVVDLANAFPNSFRPRLKSAEIHSRIEKVLLFLKLKPAGGIVKAALFIAYGAFFAIALGASLVFAVIGYREALATKTVDGKDIRYAQVYMMGALAAEIPVDEKDRLDGEGLSYGAKDGKPYVDGRTTYVHGYKSGIWIDYDQDGAVIKKTTYERGKFLGSDILKDGAWIHKEFKDLSLFDRFKEALSLISSPRASLGKRFKT